MEDLVKSNNMEQYYKDKKVFVTGHTGFKGSWFISWLSLAGAKIKGYALPANDKSLFNIISSNFNFETVIADIRDKERLQQEILSFEPDFIFHFAAQPLVRRSYEIPAETFQVNAIGTANLLESVSRLKNPCSIIIITTDKVYENQGTDHYYNETDVLGGYDPYSASKACAEMIVNSFRKSFFNPAGYDNHKKAIACVRAGNVIGGGDWSTDRILPDIVASLSASQAVKVRSPNAVRPWQFVLEPLNGYLLLGMLLHRNPSQYSGAYNFGPYKDDHLPVRQLVEIAINCWGSGTWVDTSGDFQPHEAGLLQLDIGKAINELGWKPKLNSKEAIEWTVGWYSQREKDKFEYTLGQIKNYQQR